MAEIRSNGLTEKQKMFCEEYVANGYKAVAAYQAAYPKASYESANAGQWNLLKKEAIKQYIREIQHDRFEALNINADRIAEELAKMAFADFDDNNSASTKQKALELLAKQLGLYTTKVDMNGEQSIIIKITGDEDDEG